MFARIESLFHSLRRRLSRTEWAICHLRLDPSEGTAEEPGLLLIQIDGLARQQFERAVARRRMPFLRRLMTRDGYELRTFYPGLPSTTPAVQAELYYGKHSAVPAFSFFDRTVKKLGRMWDPEWAKAREAKLQAEAAGLLEGGSSWSNIYTGGAVQEESHFCAASIGLGDMWRSGKFRNTCLFLILQLPAALRIAWMLLVEAGVAIVDGAQAIARGRRPKMELMLLLSRVAVGVGLRELLTIGVSIDVARGLPIVHVNFVGYDEHAHIRGPGSRLAHYGLRGIDRAIRRIVRAAQRSRRRDYSVWIFSDHGQEATKTFFDLHPGGIEALIDECMEASRKHDAAWRIRSQTRPVSAAAWLSRGQTTQRHLHRQRADETLTEQEVKTFVVAAMGPVGHIYFSTPLSEEQKLALARRLIEHGVPGALIRNANGSVAWLDAHGTRTLPDIPSLPHPDEIAQRIAADLTTFALIPEAGDIILLGWVPGSRPISFAPESGGHGGLGPEETQGFLLLPRGTLVSSSAQQTVRPSELRAAARHFLGRESLAQTDAGAITERALRLMTYNVHGCGGTDGRVSPRRIARVIAEQRPDIVALQEIDLGRRRSRAEDQAKLIADQLSMHLVFCPTVASGEERYGHALLSRWPIQIRHRAFLPADKRSWWKEPRAALWARIEYRNEPVNVITTHLGLGARERQLQIERLLSEEWLGAIPPDEPVLVCGDLNLAPGSAPYRMLAACLSDVQLASKRRRPLSTFSSYRPFIRLDHIFISPHFSVQQVTVPRNSLTRRASDHLPLLADLSLVPAFAEMPIHTTR